MRKVNFVSKKKEELLSHLYLSYLNKSAISNTSLTISAYEIKIHSIKNEGGSKSTVKISL
jgi:hypothetical protein